MAAVRPAAPQPAYPVRVLHQRYIVSRIVLGAANEAVRAALEQEDLDDLDDDAMDRLRADLTPPKGFRAQHRKHRASVDYLEQLGVRELVHNTAEALEVLCLLRTPRVREIVEVGLIVDVPREALVERVRQQHTIASRRALELFERWFWDVTAFDRVALRRVLELRALRRGARGATNDGERVLAARIAKADPRILAVSLPRTPAAWHLALGAMGHAPSSMPVDKVLVQLRSHAALRAAESVMRGGPGDETRAAAFVSILKVVEELYRQVVPPDTALREGLASLALRTDPTPLPTIHDLSGGNHTVDLQRHAPLADA